MSSLSTLTRILNGVMDAINRYKAQKATDNSASTIANGSSVQHSDTAYSDLSNKDGGDTTE